MTLPSVAPVRADEPGEEPPGPPPEGMTWIPGGSFAMGSDLAEYPEEGPVRSVAVDGFWMDTTPVTVAQFRAFVADTGYLTVAERPLDPSRYPRIDPRLLKPGSLVFTPPSRPVDLADMTAWWRYVAGASWSRPEGPGSSTAGRDDHPVVHVAWDDAAAYADWAGKTLPTEAEWERAARGGLEGRLYAWGDEFTPGGRRMAKTWDGDFPWLNRAPASRKRTAAVGSYPPNGFGLLDITGNVWEWTSDFYRADHSALGDGCCAVRNPRMSDPEGSYDSREPGGAHIPRRVIKGGSHLCAASYCARYRPAARQAQQIESSMSHIGFRCVRRTEGENSDA